MKTSSYIFVLLISFASFSQQTEFTVAAGVQRTLTAAERTLSLKNFVLGDGCVIFIPASMDGWTVTATDVTIGKNVQILGMGSNGASGSAGLTGSSGANCMPGGNGSSGGMGSPGGPGKNVSLTLRIRKIESLRINVNGGNGGYGALGGSGGKGGNATCDCNAGAGGNGGIGGRGGNGGIGGRVNILYSVVGSASVSNSNFIIQSMGGIAGMRGGAGFAGAGGTPTCTDPKAVVRLTGRMGTSGVPGPLGTQGANGVTTIQQQ